MYSGGGWGGKGECKNDVKDRVEVSIAMVGVNIFLPILNIAKNTILDQSYEQNVSL